MVCPFPKLQAQLPKERVEFICQDFAPFAGALAGSPFAGCPVVTAPCALAAMVARIAGERGSGDPAGLDANYVRRSDAELLFKPW